MVFSFYIPPPSTKTMHRWFKFVLYVRKLRESCISNSRCALIERDLLIIAFVGCRMVLNKYFCIHTRHTCGVYVMFRRCILYSEMRKVCINTSKTSPRTTTAVQQYTRSVFNVCVFYKFFWKNEYYKYCMFMYDINVKVDFDAIYIYSVHMHCILNIILSINK